jgi:hypothetical protein
MTSLLATDTSTAPVNFISGFFTLGVLGELFKSDFMSDSGI